MDDHESGDDDNSDGDYDPSYNPKRKFQTQVQIFFCYSWEKKKNIFIETKLIIMVLWSFVLYDSLVNITVKVT